MEELLRLLGEVRPDVDFATEDKLIDGEVLDSFDIITIVNEVNEAFDVQLGADVLTPENFNSAKALWALIESER